MVMVLFCGVHCWQPRYLEDMRALCSTRASQQVRDIGMLPAWAQHALVKQPMLTKHASQRERETQEGGQQHIETLQSECLLIQWF